MERARIAAVALLALAAMAASDATPTGTTTTTTVPVSTPATEQQAPDRPPAARSITTTTTTLPQLDTSWRAIPNFALSIGVTREMLPSANPWVRMASGQPAPPSTEISLYRRMAPYGTVVPMLAADPEPPPAVQDGERWIADVRLREDIAWSDGTPVSSRDLAFSFRQANVLGITDQAGFPTNAAGEQTLIDVSPVADHAVRFVWSERPSAAQWPLGSAFAPVHPEHYWMPLAGEARSLDELDPLAGEEAPSAAAYRLAGGDDGRLLLRAVDGHWEGGSVVVARADGTIDYRNPRLEIDESYGPGGDTDAVASWTLGPFAERVELVAFSDQEEALLALAAGDLDLVLSAEGIDPNLAATVAGNPGIRRLVSPLPDPTGLAVDPKGAVADTVGLHQALDCLLDRDRLSTLTGGRVLPALTAVPGGWGGWAPPAQPACSGSEADRAREAVRLLTEAGWSWQVEPGPGDDGMVSGAGAVTPDGSRPDRLTLSAPGAIDDPVGAFAAGEAVRMIELLGLDVSLRPPGRSADLALETVRIAPDPWAVTESLGLDPSTPEARRLELAGSTADAAAAAIELVESGRPGFLALYRTSLIEAVGMDVQIPITSVGGLLAFSGTLESLRPALP